MLVDDISVKTTRVTLLFIIEGQRILLAEKKRGWRAGIFNGIGGKVDEGETFESAMIRETQEEIGVTPTKFDKVAVLDFDVYFKGELGHLHCHTFVATEYDGVPVETDEMRPQWFDFAEIPYGQMWSDDIHWLPKVLAGEKLKCYFAFDKDNQIISQKIDVVEGFN